MARGDFAGALKFLDDKLDGLEPGETRTALQLKKCQALFLSGELDSSLIRLTHLMAELNDTDPYLNDVMELKGFIDESYSRGSPRARDAFHLYLKGEKLLKQANLTEAREVFRQVELQYPADPITPYAVFRGGKIDLILGNWEGAKEQFMSLRDTPLGDRATAVIGEIYQYHLHDRQKAARWYLTVLEDYPDTMLAEPIRYRIRAISAEAGG